MMRSSTISVGAGSTVAALLAWLTLIASSAPGQRPSAGPPGASPEEAVDVEVLVALNVSWALDLNELEVQRTALVEALESLDWSASSDAVARPRVAFSVLEWAASQVHDQILPWLAIRNADDVGRIREVLMKEPTKSARGASYASVMNAARLLLTANGYHGKRRVLILASTRRDDGDADLAAARAGLAKAGIEVIGIPLMLRAPWEKGGFGHYFADQILPGREAQLIPVSDIFDLHNAYRSALLSAMAHD